MKMDGVLTIEETAAQAKVQPNTIRLWLRSGKLKGIKAGKLWRVRPRDLEAFMEASAIPHPEIVEDTPAMSCAETLLALVQAIFLTHEITVPHVEDFPLAEVNALLEPHGYCLYPRQMKPARGAKEPFWRIELQGLDEAQHPEKG
jgi:excisionase family DNA binding protein